MKQRAGAVTLVQHSASQAVNRDTNYEALVRHLLTETLEAQRRAYLAEFVAKRSEVKAQVYEKYDRLRKEIEDTIDRQMEAVLKEPVDKMHSELLLAKAEAQRTGSREQEVSLALQLSATLAVSQQQQAKLYKEAYAREKAQRGKLLLEIDKIQAPAILTNSVSTKVVDQIMAGLSENNKDYRRAVESTRDALSDFILNHNAEGFARNVVQGFVGDSLFSLVSPYVNGLMGDMESALNENLIKLGQFAQGKAEENDRG